MRRASRKYRKLHRRQASAQVRADRGRGKAAAKNQRSAVKAEVFEDALARVSRSLSKAAKESAAELKAERLAMAQGRIGRAAEGVPHLPGLDAERRPNPGEEAGTGDEEEACLDAGRRCPATGQARRSLGKPHFTPEPGSVSVRKR